VLPVPSRAVLVPVEALVDFVGQQAQPLEGDAEHGSQRLLDALRLGAA